MDGITEIRPGNAVFYDMVQVGLGVAEKEQCALTVLSSVASIQKGRIVLDAGSKALALDKGAHGNDVVIGHGHIREHEDLVIESLSEEHGVIPTEQTGEVTFGEKLTIIPNHACPVVNLFDYYTVHKDGKVIDYWSVSARGQKQLIEVVSFFYFDSTQDNISASIFDKVRTLEADAFHSTMKSFRWNLWMAMDCVTLI